MLDERILAPLLIALGYAILWLLVGWGARRKANRAREGLRVVQRNNGTVSVQEWQRRSEASLARSRNRRGF